MAKLDFPQLNTNRLLLRKFILTDSKIVTKLAGAFEIADTTLRIPHPYKTKDAIDWIKKHDDWFDKDHTINWAITLKDNNNLIGAISLMNFTETFCHAEIGYWIGKPFWGKGFATEAAHAVLKYGFNTLKLNRMHAHHFSRNVSSGKILKKVGMKHEGTLRQHVVKWDKFEDIELYGILKSDILE
jgi:RimJ/RimL family protein N-acetyltransferase